MEKEFTVEQILCKVRECRLTEGFKELFEYVSGEGGFQCIIMSGGNTLFIGEILKQLGI
jgi:phosphoserine phosphatase